MGNQKPVFAQKDITFLTMRVMGKNKDMGKFTVLDEQGNRFEMILFRQLEDFLSDIEEKYGKAAVDYLRFPNGKYNKPIKMNIIYYPGLNRYMGREEIQFIIKEWK